MCRTLSGGFGDLFVSGGGFKHQLTDYNSSMQLWRSSEMDSKYPLYKTKANKRIRSTNKKIICKIILIQFSIPFSIRISNVFV